MIITFVHHSCFVLETNERVLIFDYFKDGNVKGYTFTCLPAISIRITST